jgi:thiol-disulfide isomerase/thioredoxin
MRRIVFVFVSFLFCNLLYAQNPKITTLPINSSAPDFSLPGVDGKTYTLDDFKQYPILAVLFTCNHCPTAQAYEEKIIKLVNEFRPRGVGFVAISPNSPKGLSLSELGYSDMGDDLEDMKKRAKDKKYNFPYLYDGETQETSMKYGPVATPHIFIFNKDRKLKYTGRIDDTENPYITANQTDTRNAIMALLENREIQVKKTKTFGCSIKWAWKSEWKLKLEEDWAKAPVDIEIVNTEQVREIMKNDGKKLRLINVWATWCGPCIIELPDFIIIDRMYRGRDFEFITISADKKAKENKALDFLKKIEASNTNYLYGGDNQYDLIEAIDPEWQGALPYTALIEPGGNKIYRIEGTIQPYELKKKIVNYLGRYYADDK